MKILYICTHNRCRSILSEAVTQHKGQGLLEARSAGSQPSGEVHPLSLTYLAEAGIATVGLQSQSWDEFADFAPDVVITVCDSAAQETCPVWFGDCLVVHWGLADPSKLVGSEEQKAIAFRQTIQQIEHRVEQLLAIARQAPEQWGHSLQQALPQSLQKTGVNA
ncbi:arsenate reductase ArsC [Oceanisphaera pacifica]|uniref:Arsenate reductase ArsC n=1 Tax=Oceanisphaera pacifica TaxID=2818389 RepID=A0ABS3NDV3_9GAMM|nr:arsenate reductase ArsC [Oceanisphaera pacifica]MBO1518774.1 arsenate reductase ArsC [Oceanisphaera pacifica]